jgi:hypothetical protein
MPMLDGIGMSGGGRVISFSEQWAAKAKQVDKLVPSLRPDNPIGSTTHPFDGIPKALHPEVFDILGDLSLVRAGRADQGVASRLFAREPHLLRNKPGGPWWSLDIDGRANPLRFTFRAEPDGLVWRVENTHATNAGRVH